MNETIERALYRGICINKESIDFGKWIFGNLVEDGECYIKPATNCFCCEDSYIEVNPNTVGQWTGISTDSDSGDSKVFVDDFVACDYIEVEPMAEYHEGVVYYDVDMCSYRIRCKGGETWPLTKEFCKFNAGSIHDHPELLKGGE